MRVVAIVGMAGSGKSEVARIFEENGFTRVRFGDLTDEKVKKRGLSLNEENERRIRGLLREEHGMAAYAKLNLPRIDSVLKTSDVVVDGLYSWEEYLLLREYYGDEFSLVCVWAPPKTRYARLFSRKTRPLTHDEAWSRDRSEIEKASKGGPIAMADFTLLNDSSLKNLEEKTRKVIGKL